MMNVQLTPIVPLLTKLVAPATPSQDLSPTSC
jgi:hypothetical protein